MELKKIKTYCTILFWGIYFYAFNQDTITYNGVIAIESIKKESMLNCYLIDDGIYSDKGFYVISDSVIQYNEGFLCLSTLKILDSNSVGEGFSYLYNFYDFLESTNNNKEKSVYYTNNKNHKKLLRKINSKKVRNSNYPIIYAFDQSYIGIESLGVCYIPFKAKITAVAMKEYDFKRYVFDGKNLKLKEIKFYYISELEIEGHKIR